jgi:hypothetical protein
MGDSYCALRKLRMTNPTPPTRFTPISPYTNENRKFTKEELDMRRKVEILKYANTKASNKINRPTRSETFSGIVRRNQGNRRVNDCSNTPQLSSNSDVPGKPIYLRLDKNVPLYNYRFNEIVYAESPE